MHANNTVSTSKQLRRAVVSTEERRTNRVLLRLRTGCISRAHGTPVRSKPKAVVTPAPLTHTIAQYSRPLFSRPNRTHAAATKKGN